MEMMEWPINLPSIATHDGFALIVEKLIQDSGQLSILHPTDNSSDQDMAKDKLTEMNLRLRRFLSVQQRRNQIDRTVKFDRISET
jgi:hypothetical protein